MKELEENEATKQATADKKWMEEQLKKEKELLGEDFGEDVDLDFGE